MGRTAKRLNRTIAGAGSKKGRTPYVQPDTVRAQQAVQILDIISEGPIKGLVPNAQGDPRASVFFDEVPIVLEDGSTSVELTGFEFRHGEPHQPPMKNFKSHRTTTVVNVKVEKRRGPVVRRFNNKSANSVVVSISSPAMYRIHTGSGSTFRSGVDFDIQIRPVGGSWTSHGPHKLIGKWTSTYSKDYRIDLGTGHGGDFEIRVLRLTDDSDDTNHINAIYFAGFTVEINNNMTYANTAVVGLSGNAENFSQLPERGYLVDGLIISVPSNYDPVTRQYTGTWDGTFKQAHTNNPAWVLYDLITSKRYGAGRNIPSHLVDKWTLYNIAQYCDEQVDDGFGGTEPRYTCNAYIFTDDDAYELIQNYAAVFGGMVYWGAGAIHATQDRPREVAYIFNNANVVGGKFDYKGTSLRSRHTSVSVTWYDPSNLYKPTVEYVQDDEAVERWGLITAQVAALGCTSRGQAARFGRRLLYTEQYETEVVTFTTGMEGFLLTPGDVIRTSDITRSSKRMGGRIVSASGNSVELDAAVKLESGNTYTLTLIGSDGIPVSLEVATGAGETKTLELRGTLNNTPQPDSVWVLHTPTTVSKLWRVVSLEVSEGTNVTVSALAYRPDKYDAIDKNLKLDALRYSNIKTIPDKPTNPSFLVSYKNIGGTLTGMVGTLSWESTAPNHTVLYRHAEAASWTTAEAANGENSIDIADVQEGKYSFKITPYSSVGFKGNPLVWEYEVTPQAVKLPNATGLALEGRFTGDTAKFKWDAVPGATGYTVRVIVGGQVKREVAVGDALRFDYSAADMRADGGPWRGFDFAVKATGRWGSESDWASITVGNRQAGAPIAINVSAGLEVGYVSLTAPPEDDVVGMVVWCSTVPSCPPVESNKVYDGPVGMVTITKLAGGQKLEAGRTYYVRAAVHDSFGRDNLNASTSVPFTPLLVDIGPNTITETEIKDDSISTPKLRASAVRAHNIAANEILGLHVRGRQFTGEHMQLGTLDVSHFRSGLGSGNILPNAGLIPSWSNGEGQQADGWLKNNNLVNTAVSPDAANKPPNTEYMRLQPASAQGGTVAIFSEHFTVAPNTWYELNAKGVCGAGAMYLQLQFYNAAGGALRAKEVRGNSRILGGRFSRDLSGWMPMFTLYQAPAGAVSARFTVNLDLPGRNASASYFTQPYVGVATSSLQGTPTPWSPSGLGTQIHGGMIKTNTIHASAIGVDRLSAFTANLGHVTSGSLNINNRFIVDAAGNVTIKTAHSGARLELTNNLVQVFDRNGRLRVRLGLW